jgi:hypothetical protein
MTPHASIAHSASARSTATSCDNPLMGVYQYSVYGLAVASDFPLALPQEASEESANLCVRLELVSPDNFPVAAEHRPSAEGGWFQHAVLDNGSVYMRWEDFFEFIITADGRRVLCKMLSKAEIESFEAYLTTLALSGALIQQGEEPLHATVVAIDGSPVGLIGPSGAGKSTLAAFLIERGGELVTDDMLRLEFRDNVAVAFPGPRRLKLFNEPAQRILKQALDCGRFNPFSEKHIFQPVSFIDRRKGPLPLSALYFLDPSPQHRDPNSISIERLFGVDLFKTIAAATMNSRLNAADRLERQFRFTERIANGIPVYKLMYPRDYDLLDQVADLIDQTASL